MAKKLPHSGASSKVIMALVRALLGGWCIWPENPILVDAFTAPLPDATVVRGTADVYTRRKSVPKADEIGLVVELADTSLQKNLTESLQTYARAGLPVYWVVNLVAHRVEVFSQPVIEGDSSRYASSDQYEPGKDVALILDGREVARIPAHDLVPEEAP
jgi:Uma2 family endonuclease